jgi:hypothetical protein
VIVGRPTFLRQPNDAVDVADKPASRDTDGNPPGNASLRLIHAVTGSLPLTLTDPN